MLTQSDRVQYSTCTSVLSDWSEGSKKLKFRFFPREKSRADRRDKLVEWCAPFVVFKLRPTTRLTLFLIYRIFDRFLGKPPKI